MNSQSASQERGIPEPVGSAPPQVDVLLGSCIDDRYELVELIGRGARSLVYRADDLQLNRSVTLKLIPDGRCTADRLERVSRATASSCPNLVAVFDAGDAAEGAYVVMETLVGTTLTHVLEHEGVSTQMVLRIMAAAADGITAAHRAGLVHSNLVASNVFLTADHAVKVLDVGACSVDFCGPSAPGLLEPFDAEPSTFEELGVIAPVPAHTAPARRNVQSLVRLLEALLFGPRSHEGTGLAAVPPELQRGAFATSFEHVTSAAELAFELARLADAIDERASIASDAPSRPRVSVRREPGAVALAGRYSVRCVTDCGTLVRAEDERSGADVFVSACYGGTTDLPLREQEARAFADVRHPHLLPLRDYGVTDDGIWFAVTEHCEGETLLALLRRQERLTAATALQIATEASRALAALHDHGAAIPVLAPCTLFLEKLGDGFVTRVMYGGAILPRSAAKRPECHATCEPEEDIWGATHRDAYQSPEVLAGQPANERSGVYGLAVLLYRMLTGSLPVGAHGLRRLDDSAGDGVPAPRRPPPEPRMSDTVAGALSWALAADPDDRPDVATFEATLDWCRADVARAAVRTSATRRERSRNALVCALAVAFACAVGVLEAGRDHRAVRDVPLPEAEPPMAAVARDPGPPPPALTSLAGAPPSLASTDLSLSAVSSETRTLAGPRPRRVRLRAPFSGSRRPQLVDDLKPFRP